MLGKLKSKFINWLLKDVHLDEIHIGEHSVVISATGANLDGQKIENVGAPDSDDDVPRRDTIDSKITTHAGVKTAHHSNLADITFIIDGGGSVITTGSKGYLEVPFACTITGWTISADQSGSIVVDVKRCTYAGFPTTTSIAGTEKPTLSATQKNQDLSLTTWTTAIAAGDILEFVVDSATTVTRVTVSLRATKT